MRPGGMVVVALAALLLGAGCSSPEPTARVVDGGGSADPDLVADFGYDVELENTQTTSCPVTSITFTDESTGEPTSWRWEFSDGTGSDEQHPVIHRAVDEATLRVERGSASDAVTMSVTYPVC